MTLPPVFPAADDDGYGPFRAIAEKLGVEERQVDAAFRGLEPPEWASAEHMRAVQKMTAALSESARLARALRDSLSRLPIHDAQDLTIAGHITPYQIEKLAVFLEDNSNSLGAWRQERYPGGNANPDAHIVAEGVRRLFRRLRKPITFGQDHSGGGPSTDFGKAVEFALSAFGVRANWRRAAEKAWKKQLAIENRRVQRAISAHEKQASTNRNDGNF